MNPHPHFDVCRSPWFAIQLLLRIDRGIQRVFGRVERSGKRITYHLEDIAVISFNGLVQNLVMSRQKHRHLIWMLLCQFGAAFDVGKEKSNGAGWV